MSGTTPPWLLLPRLAVGSWSPSTERLAGTGVNDTFWRVWRGDRRVGGAARSGDRRRAALNRASGISVRALGAGLLTPPVGVTAGLHEAVRVLCLAGRPSVARAAGSGDPRRARIGADGRRTSLSRPTSGTTPTWLLLPRLAVRGINRTRQSAAYRASAKANSPSQPGKNHGGRPSRARISLRTRSAWRSAACIRRVVARTPR